MAVTNQAEIKRLARQIRIRFPGWKIEGLLLQDVDRKVFKVSRDGRTAHLHAVSFRPGEKAEGSKPKMKWQMRAGSYLAWVKMLSGMRESETLALPSSYADASSILHGRVKTVFAMRPELLPLEERPGQMYGPLEIAQMLHAVCHALRRCRDERIPHGELSRQHLMKKAGGGYCLDGMLEPQRLDDFNQMMPSEASEVQQAALLVRDVAKDCKQSAVADYAADSLYRLIDRAAVREKGLTLQRMLTELDSIIEELSESPVSSGECPAAPGASAFRDMTDLFPAADNEDTVGVRGKHAMPAADLEMTVGVRGVHTAGNSPRSEAKHAAAPDPDVTVGVRNPALVPSRGAVQSDSDDDERTIKTL